MYSCQSCGCDLAGSEEGLACDITTGVCRCKRYVTGTVCDRCASGFQLLEASNPLGCSAGKEGSRKAVRKKNKKEKVPWRIRRERDKGCVN